MTAGGSAAQARGSSLDPPEATAARAADDGRIICWRRTKSLIVGQAGGRPIKLRNQRTTKLPDRQMG